MTTFKTPELQHLYDEYLFAACNTDSFLYHDGEPRRGSSTRAAFWNGYDGIKTCYTTRGTFGYAAYAAGRDYRKA